MKLKTVLILILFSVLLSSSCNSQETTKYFISDNIKSTFTKEHKLISKTHVYMIPPKGFDSSENFSGFENLDKGGIQIFETIGDNFFKNTKSFSKEFFEKKGAKVEELKELKLNTFMAKYVLLQPDLPIKRLLFNFGDSTFSVMVLADFNKADLDLENQIKKSIESIYFDKKVKIDPFDNAPFNIVNNKSRYIFTEYNMNSYSFSINGETKKKGNDDPFIGIFIMPLNNKTAAGLSIFLNESLERLGSVIDTIVDGKYQEKDGTKVFETQIYVTNKNEKKLFYRYILEDKERAIVVMGVANNNFEENFREFSIFSSSIQLKR